jgi:hypothetical protein
MFNPHHDDAAITERQAQLLREANAYRLVNQGRPRRPALHQRALANLGGWMIVTGNRLQGRYHERVDPLRLGARVNVETI